VTDEQVLDAFDRAIALDSGSRQPTSTRGARVPAAWARAAAGTPRYLALEPDRQEAEESARGADRPRTRRLARGRRAARHVPTPCDSRSALRAAPLARLGRDGADAGPRDRAAAADLGLVRDGLRLVQRFLHSSSRTAGGCARRTRRSATAARSCSRSSCCWAASSRYGVGGVRALAGRRVTAARSALPWWARAGDVASIERFRVRARLDVRCERPWHRLRAAHDTGAARAYLHSARRDSAGGAAQLRQLSTHSVCRATGPLSEARLLIARGRVRQGRHAARQRLYTVMTPPRCGSRWSAARARRSATRPRAVRAYSLVVNAWERGDLRCSRWWRRRARRSRAPRGGRVRRRVAAGRGVQAVARTPPIVARIRHWRIGERLYYVARFDVAVRRCCAWAALD
jgi:hypothetical protein